ncbi:MAG: hypothetical protein ABSG04_05315 [Verrucomicrobiota bacterium]
MSAEETKQPPEDFVIALRRRDKQATAPKLTIHNSLFTIQNSQFPPPLTAGRSFSPVFAATVEPAMHGIVLGAWTGPRRREAEILSRLVGMELNLRWFTSGGQEVRTVQELECILQ